MTEIFNPQIGDYVLCCYDGKLYRQTTGKIIEKESDNRIKVRFYQWAFPDKEPVENWFDREGEEGFGAVLKDPESLGALAFGEDGDWYSVFDVKYKGLNGLMNPIKDFVELAVP